MISEKAMIEDRFTNSGLNAFGPGLCGDYQKPPGFTTGQGPVSLADRLVKMDRLGIEAIEKTSAMEPAESLLNRDIEQEREVRSGSLRRIPYDRPYRLRPEGTAVALIGQRGVR